MALHPPAFGAKVWVLLKNDQWTRLDRDGMASMWRHCNVLWTINIPLGDIALDWSDMALNTLHYSRCFCIHQPVNTSEDGYMFILFTNGKRVVNLIKPSVMGKNGPLAAEKDVNAVYIFWFMMTSSNGNIFRVTGHLYGECTGRWIPRTKASDVELWCFFFICA